ncbi:MAG: hypothetical protein GY814_12160, partial [Gammaproteobacteria bacterium]|nr:hypothetical protein [Gammaproteobacteria bacterium]
MKLEHIVALAIRLFAIVLAIYAIRNGVSLVPHFAEQGWKVAAPIHAGIMVSLVVLAIALWWFPLTVAKGLVNFKEGANQDVCKVEPKVLEAAAYTVLGLYLLFGVLSDVIYWLFILLVTNRNPQMMIEITLEQKAAMVTTAVEFVFVLFLLLGSKRMV